jgi:hypothetical protein
MPAMAPAKEASTLEALVERRAGVTLACGPLIALALARERGEPVARVTGRWRGRHAAIDMAVGAPAA